LQIQSSEYLFIADDYSAGLSCDRSLYSICESIEALELGENERPRTQKILSLLA
jgi:hypothetical protein